MDDKFEVGRAGGAVTTIILEYFVKRKKVQEEYFVISESCRRSVLHNKGSRYSSPLQFLSSDCQWGHFFLQNHEVLSCTHVLWTNLWAEVYVFCSTVFCLWVRTENFSSSEGLAFSVHYWEKKDGPLVRHSSQIYEVLRGLPVYCNATPSHPCIHVSYVQGEASRLWSGLGWLGCSTHLAKLLSQFCHFPISPSRIRQIVD